MGVYYEGDVYATGMGNSPTWTVSAGTLPPGLTCCTPCLSATAITGTPTQVGTFTFSLSASGSSQTVSRSFTLKVVPNDVTITTTSLPSGDTASDYYQFIEAVRGGTGRTWSIVEGSLPPGIVLSGSGSAILLGRPTKAGVFPFTVQVSDSKSTAKASLSITITRAPLSIQTSFGVPDGINGSYYQTGFWAQGGSGNKTWSVSNGTLPPGLSFSASTLSLFGTLAQTGTFSFTLRVDDDTSFATADYTIHVAEIFKVTTTSLPNGSVGSPYSFQLQSVSGHPGASLEDGRSLYHGQGVILPAAVGKCAALAHD